MSLSDTSIQLLHTADIAPESPVVLNAQRWLSTAERERQKRFKNPQAQHNYLLGRALLRGCLSQYCQTPPEQLQLAISEGGKPYLCTVQPKVHFNLSHSGQWLALAISHQGPVGVDIEHPQKPRDFIGIARHYFHRSEYLALKNLQGDTLQNAFYRLWTLKEAFLKARGTGISEGLAHIRFNADNTPITASIAPEWLTLDNNWQFHYWHKPQHNKHDCHLALASLNPNATAPTINRITKADLLKPLDRV